MKIVEQDLKKGIVVVKIQSYDDCWHLYNIIEPGDYISGYTYRSVQQAGDKIRKKKGEKERVYLKIKVTDKEFHEFTNRLRIRGIIVEGSEEKAYHTFNIEPDMEIKIEKEWKDVHLKRLKEALKKHPKLCVLAIDDEAATIAIIHEYGIEEIANIKLNRKGKMYDGNEEKNYGEILSKVAPLELPLVIIGPGFEKENFVEFARGKLKNYIVESTAHAGMVGIKEAIKRGIIEKIDEKNRVAKEMRVVEEILEEIAKNGAVAYGKEEVEKAIEMGAVEKLVILNSMVRKEEELLKKAEEMRAGIIIVSDLHEGGEKLAALGGLAALLRFRLS
ncbi:MAG: mRNA surveillance protein pelota [Thermoplasmata archaeon]|nr:MAG: mRNA surveillance protein pelota [Thermoplasmata archaeon]